VGHTGFEGSNQMCCLKDVCGVCGRGRNLYVSLSIPTLDGTVKYPPTFLTRQQKTDAPCDASVNHVERIVTTCEDRTTKLNQAEADRVILTYDDEFLHAYVASCVQFSVVPYPSSWSPYGISLSNLYVLRG